MRQPDDVLPHNDLLMALCYLKARTPVIRDLTGDRIPELFIKTMYEKINGTHVPQGQLPSGVLVFMRTPRTRLQASVAVRAFEKFKGIVDEDWRYVHAYRAYQRTFPNDLIYDFNRIWFLFRQYQNGRVILTACPRCGCHYVYYREDVSDRHNCCGCLAKQRQAVRSLSDSQAAV